jgi:iron complex outermembrane receptor protein
MRDTLAQRPHKSAGKHHLGLLTLLMDSVRMNRCTLSATAAACLALFHTCVAAQGSAAAPPVNETVVITGSVTDRRLAETPHAISAVTAAEMRSAGPLIGLSEVMARVPGLVVANRWNFAQDLQISSRGFGARAGFGVRGVRLYTDGIPASGPDGQGQVSHFDLASAARVEVLRGPFSALYGNSSGGVIALFSAPVKERKVEAAVEAGSFGLRQIRVAGETLLGAGVDLRATAATMQLEGFRPHSQAERHAAQISLGFTGSRDSVKASLNHLDQPADDPLGLSRAQFDADPLQVTPQAEQFNTRKTTQQTQLGVRWKHRFDGPVLKDSEVAFYGGRRAVVQFLAIAAATQANERHGGGVLDFERAFGGTEARLRLGWDTVDVVVGASLDRQRDDRKGFENFVGIGAAQVLGVTGALRRDEENRAASNDVFAQAEWAWSPALSLSAGLRSGRVELRTDDRFIKPPPSPNGNDSGERSFSYTNPVLGLRWGVAAGLNLHASVGQGYESPTLGELAYRVDGSGGFNTTLQAQKSRQVELGAKWRAGAFALDTTLFETRATDEIGVALNSGGRSAFQNVGRTLRRGAEVAAQWQAAANWSASLAATMLDATYRDTFLVCAGIPCTTPTSRVAAGNRIAGTQRGIAFGELSWRDAAFGAFGIEVRHSTAITANDLNTDGATGATVAALRWQHEWPLTGSWRAQWLLRVDNVGDRRYAGSVIVNDANGRFFETAAPRNVMLSLRLIGP